MSWLGPDESGAGGPTPAEMAAGRGLLAERDAAAGAYWEHRHGCVTCHLGGRDSGCPEGTELALAFEAANAALPLPPQDPPW